MTFVRPVYLNTLTLTHYQRTGPSKCAVDFVDEKQVIDADGSGTLHITELVQAGFSVWKNGMKGHLG